MIKRNTTVPTIQTAHFVVVQQFDELKLALGERPVFEDNFFIDAIPI